MDARVIKTAALAALSIVTLTVTMGARQQSANFIVETADPRMAARISQAAEQYRHDLAIAWIGHAMPNWSQPCQMTVQVGPQLGAGGATTFVFDHGEVFGWRMTIQGSAERVLDSVLPHEITHMVFASHFRRPLPRWADEGGATSVEHFSEKDKHRRMLVQFLRTNRGIAFNDMFRMTEYPQDIMPLYAQGYSLAEFLIFHGGKQHFVDFLGEGMSTGEWSAAVEKYYHMTDLGVLQNTWVAWVAQGFPAPPPEAAATLVANNEPVPSQLPSRPAPNLIYHVSEERPIPTSATAKASVSVPAESLVPVDSGYIPSTVGTAQALPASAWRSADGSAPQSSTDGQYIQQSSQVSRPPLMEPARQSIIEMNQR